MTASLGQPVLEFTTGLDTVREHMNLMSTSLAVILAAAEGEAESFPLPYQITCIILTALFLWTFSIARDPRSWRRLYQAKFVKKEDFSVNKNKQIDEAIKKYGIVIAMAFLVADVSFFVLGVTHRYRNSQRSMTKDEQFRAMDAQRIRGSGPKDAARRAVGG